VHEIDEI
jgi:hypothetical protein